MFLDFRYHIVTLVAVFLALSIGIVIGTILLGNDAIVQQQREMTDRLAVHLQEIRAENQLVQARINVLENDITIQNKFEKQVLPALVSGKLTGKTIAIIETGNYRTPDQLLSTLEMAGAQVASITTISGNLNPAGSLAELPLSLDLIEDNTKSLAEQLALAVATGILTAAEQDLFAALAKLELVKSIGEHGVPLHAVIIVGGTAAIDHQLISYFLLKDISVFGVEETAVIHSHIESFQKFNISTVDNIETVPGQLALVFAIAGKHGHFGVKPTAQRLLPSLELPGESG